jgi:nitrogen fixation NifU-like protein
MTLPGEPDFERMVVQIQKAIIEEERALYSEKVIQEYHHPKNIGRMSQPDAVGIVHGWCGDTMEIYLRVGDRGIVEATFVTDGCGPTVACGSKLTTLIQGMSMDRAGQLTRDDLLSALDGLPEESLHCAELAVKTLQEAIADCRPQWHEDSDGH